MNRKEYMEQLSKALEEMDEEMAVDILEDYEAHFERAMETGRTEEEIIEELGSIDEFVEELKQFTSDSAQKGSREQAGNEKESRSQYTHTGGYRYHHNYDNEDNRDYSSFGEALDRTLQEAFKAVEASTEQLRKCFGKASGRFGEWFERYEKTSEREEDYRARQERARRERERAQRDRLEREHAQREQERKDREARLERERAQREQERKDREARLERERAQREQGRKDREARFERERAQRAGKQETEGEKDRKAHVFGAYCYTVPEGPEEEAYMPSCYGSLRREEQAYRISVAGDTADIQITASPDGEMHYRYRNEGSEGSKSVYCLKKDILDGTLYLTISKNAQVQQKKSHFGILGGIFAESAELSLELELPDWIECLDIRGNSGEIHMEGCGADELYMKSCSGDITAERVKVRISEIESVSGELTIQDIGIGPEEGGDGISCTLSSTSGDINADGLHFGMGNVALDSVSGGLQVKGCDAGTLSIDSTSGDIEAWDINASESVQFHTISGDMQLGNMNAGKAEAESKSGDIEIRDCNMDSICMNTISGTLMATALSTDCLEITGMSGDIEMNKVQSGEILISVASGDVNVSGLDTEKIKVTSKASGDLSLSGSANVYILKSLSGDIRIEQKGNTDARIDSVSGTVEVGLKNNGDGFCAKLNTHGDISIDYDSLSLTEAGCGEHRYGLEGSALEIKSSSGDIIING